MRQRTYGLDRSQSLEWVAGSMGKPALLQAEQSVAIQGENNMTRVGNEIAENMY